MNPVRTIKLFGLNLALPFFRVVTKKLNEERAALLHSHRQDLGNCTKCHKLLGARAGMSFLMHLMDDHKIEPDHTYEIVADVYRRIYAAHQQRRKS